MVTKQRLENKDVQTSVNQTGRLRSFLFFYEKGHVIEAVTNYMMRPNQEVNMGVCIIVQNVCFSPSKTNAPISIQTEMG